MSKNSNSNSVKIEDKLLLMCDLDRTVIPNGKEPVSLQAMNEFKLFVKREEVILAYASGRDLGLIKNAIKEYDLPFPSIAVGDVGTNIYECRSGEYRKNQGWSRLIGANWHGKIGADIHKLICDISELTLQEKKKQNAFKQSYYIDPEEITGALLETIEMRLKNAGFAAQIISSIDQTENIGFIDIVPQSADKRHALQYLEKFLRLSQRQIVFAGDSGNDVEALASGYNAIVVANARAEIKTRVRELARARGVLSAVYFASGGFKGMNGNYTAGILEGIRHFTSIGRLSRPKGSPILL